LSSISAQEIYQSGNGTAESKTEACRIALQNAQKEALYQSGINIFSIYEKRERISNDEVKQIINYNLQSSYGFVKTVAKSEKFDFNFQNGMITCKVNGTFEVDTSKLKSQLSALSQKYENISNEEQERANKLEQKNQLLQKYQKLKIALTTEHSFYISENYYCGESLGVSQCKNELKKKVFKSFQKKLAIKHNVDEYLIKVNDIELNSDIQVKAVNGLSAFYSGQVTGKASSVRNPYLDEINSLNAYLGERQIYEKTEEEPEDNSPNFLQRTGSTIWNGTKYIGNSIWNGTGSILKFLLPKKKDKIIFNVYTEKWIFGTDMMTRVDDYDECEYFEKCEFDESFLNVEYYIGFKRFYLKLGLGQAEVKDKKLNYKDYGEDDTAEGYIYDYSYNFYSVGLSVPIFYNKYYSGERGYDFSVNIDYVIPFDLQGTTQKFIYEDEGCCKDIKETAEEIKPFKQDPYINFSITNDIYRNQIVFGWGLMFSGDSQWNYHILNFRLGYMF
jgi:hypothetical protein